MPLAARVSPLRATIAVAAILVAAVPACAPAGEARSAASAAPTTAAASATSKPASTGNVISGRATVIDGDGLEIAGTKIRLFGIDAPEIDQYCNRSDGTRWRCGQYATVELDRAVSGHDIECTVRDKDRYGRPVAVCRAGGVDLAEGQARSGFAVAYRQFSSDYVDEEASAKSAKRGVWSGKLEMPWDWRRRSSGAQHN